MKQPQIYSEPLDPRLAERLLEFPCGDDTLGEKLSAAADRLADMVLKCRSFLDTDPICSIVAEHAARQLGKKGRAWITVDPDGQVMLKIECEDSEELPSQPTTTTKMSSPVSSPASKEEGEKSSLPPITEIRADAEALGIDWKPFGKSKTKLLQAIEEAKSTPVKEEAVPETKTPESPVLSLDEEQINEVTRLGGQTNTDPTPPKPVRVVHAPPPPPKLVKLDGDSMLTEVDQIVEPKGRPPRKGTPAGDAPTRSGRKLSEIAAGAEAEIDVDAILSKVLPPTQPE